jgi:hypothetical protein
MQGQTIILFIVFFFIIISCNRGFSNLDRIRVSFRMPLGIDKGKGIKHSTIVQIFSFHNMIIMKCMNYHIIIHQKMNSI